MSSNQSNFSHLFSLIVLILLNLPATGSSSPLIVRVDPDYYPVTFQTVASDAKGTQAWKGMDIDIIRAIFFRSELDFEIVTTPFKRSLMEIEQGSIHIIPNLTLSEERSEYLNWLGPTRTTCIGLVVHNKDVNTPIKSLSELMSVASDRNLKVEYLSGASYSPYLDSALEEDEELVKNLHFLPNNNQHLKMLKLGRIFGYFFDEYEIIHRMNIPPYAQQYTGLSLHPYRLEDSCAGAFIGISKKLNSETHEKLLQSFDEINADGTFEKIRQK